nr:hypothetical protein [Rhodococcus sp. (in: high G+C Gram-positive bacteria)]
MYSIVAADPVPSRDSTRSTGSVGAAPTKAPTTDTSGAYVGATSTAAADATPPAEYP